MVRQRPLGQERSRIADDATRASCVRSISRTRSRPTVGVSGAGGLRSILALAERGLLSPGGHLSLDPGALFRQKVGHGTAQPGMGDPMGGVGRSAAGSRAGSCAGLARPPRPASARARWPSRWHGNSKARSAETASRPGSPSCGRTAPRRPPGSARRRPACRRFRRTSARPCPPGAAPAGRRTSGSGKPTPICGPPWTDRTRRTRPSAAR